MNKGLDDDLRLSALCSAASLPECSDDAMDDTSSGPSDRSMPTPSSSYNAASSALTSSSSLPNYIAVASPSRRRPCPTAAVAARKAVRSISGAAAAPPSRVTAADICLVTQVWSARRFGADLSDMPRVLAVEAAALATEHAARAHPENQLGAPAKR